MGKSRPVSVSVQLKTVTLSINVSKTSGPPGVVNVTGYLKEEVTGSPILGSSIVFWKTGVRYGEAVTYSDGSYGFFGVPVGEGRETFQTIFPGDSEYGEKATPLVIGNYTKPSTSVSISVTPTSGAPPLQVTISGKLTRNDTGAALGGRGPMNLHQELILVDSTSTSYDPATLGEYEFVVLLEKGTHSFFVEFPGDDEFLGCIREDGATVIDGEPTGADVGLALLALLVLSQE